MNEFKKSESIKAGLRKGFQDGSSKMAKRRCYGYKLNPDGELTINPDEAKVVHWIFEHIYLATAWEKLLMDWNNRVSFLPLANPSGAGKQ